jgi:ribosomal protein S18 acetylase RimI-like enzyme
MTLRKARPSDLDEIMALEEAAWNDPDIPSSEDQWRTYLTDEIVFCAMTEDGIGGVILATYEVDGSLLVDKLFVHPDYQGEGLGEELLRKFIAIQNRECAKAFLYVADYNLPAQRLFKKTGFREAGRVSALSDYTEMVRAPA